ncbi:unnamed protein product [Microthlaspi erraticum]|uniref:Uncharacterized protein n=1 Tax=Microthlaspi erraticum TaxID=1685480 RepID=A0A6D2IZB0_9BRAS|nr:unnamed protein product [Microthlaspi erraticum]
MIDSRATFCYFIPDSFPSFSTRIHKPESTSLHRMKMYGESGSPCRKPLLGWSVSWVMSTLSRWLSEEQADWFSVTISLRTRLQPQGKNLRDNLKFPEAKKSWISDMTFSFTVFQFDWKKQAENPSGPGAFPGKLPEYLKSYKSHSDMKVLNSTKDPSGRGGPPLFSEASMISLKSSVNNQGSDLFPTLFSYLVPNSLSLSIARCVESRSRYLDSRKEPNPLLRVPEVRPEHVPHIPSFGIY